MKKFKIPTIPSKTNRWIKFKSIVIHYTLNTYILYIIPILANLFTTIINIAWDHVSPIIQEGFIVSLLTCSPSNPCSDALLTTNSKHSLAFFFSPDSK